MKFFQATTKNKNYSGFTLIEILVISPIIFVVVVGIVSYLFNQYGHLVEQDAQLNLQVEAENILYGLQDDLWYANQFASDMNSNLADAYAPSGGWKYNTTPQTLIISTPALTTNHRNANRQPVYINQSTCIPPDGNGVNDVLYNNIMYFVSNGSLYKRTISAPSSLATCGSSYYKQTCPAAQVTATCLADVILTSHINSFVITYYSADNVVVTTPESASSVKVDISLSDTAFAETITANASMTLKKLNQ